MKYSITLAATLAASAANAFKVCLYSDSNWAGENDGLVTVSLAHNQFSKVGVGVASSAIVQAEAGDKQSDSMLTSLDPLNFEQTKILRES